MPPVIDAPAEGSVQRGAVNVAGKGEPAASVEIFEGGALLWTARADAVGAWSADLSFTSGQRTLAARAIDPAGNRSELSSMRRFNVDAARPGVRFTTADGSVFLPNMPATIRGSAEDNRGVTSVQLRYFDARATVVASRSATCVCGPAEISVSWSDDPPLTPGLYIVEATAVDEAGNRSDPVSISFLRLAP